MSFSKKQTKNSISSSNKKGNGNSKKEEEAFHLDIDQLESLSYQLVASKGAMNQQQDFLFKLIIIGNSGVGKSCLMHRMTNNEFNEDHEVTVGVEFGSLLFKMEDITFKL